jgi:AcrR family transcriptional regulator
LAPRSYNSPVRTAAASQTRDRILAAAAALLAEPGDIPRFSLESVAKAAGVTRFTVYSQFGSRSALLEAVFDRHATAGGLGRIPEAMAAVDPRSGLRRLIALFCDFWANDQDLIARLNAVGADDPAFREAVLARNERRRSALSVLVKRMASSGYVLKTAAPELVDILFALTSFAFFSELTAGGRSVKIACGIIQNLSADATRRANADTACQD